MFFNKKKIHFHVITQISENFTDMSQEIVTF